MKLEHEGYHSHRLMRPDAVMDLFEVNTHSLVIRIWIEEGVAERGQPTWRGHITHIPSGEQRYFEDLDDIKAFILPHLRKAGVADA